MPGMPHEPPMDVIATRTLELDGEPVIEVRIGRPAPSAEGDCWFCPYEIIGPGMHRRSRFGGEDSMQALVHALYALSVDLETSDENRAGRLSWFGDRNLGLPSLPILTAPEDGQPEAGGCDP